MNKIEEVKCHFEIVSLDSEEGFVLHKRKDNLKITIYDKEQAAKIIDHNFNKKYRELLYIIMELNNSEDTTDSDTTLALMKIDDLRTILLNKYYMFLSKGMIEKYMNMLLLLEEKVPIIEKNRGR